jgi:CMP-N,N'-diacetyllegionaminic acid synthase
MFNKCILVLARGGSKGIPKKNLLNLNNRPLIQYAIDAAKHSLIKDIFVSSDSSEILDVSRNLDVMTVERPKEISQDLSTDLEGFDHFLQSVDKEYDYIVHIRATFPMITSEIIDSAIELFEKNYDNVDSLRSVIPVSQNPYKMWHISDDGFLNTVIPNNSLHSSPRQIIKNSFIQNACIDIVKTSTIIDKKSIIGDVCLPFVMNKDFDFDIDTLEDIQKKEIIDALHI